MKLSAKDEKTTDEKIQILAGLLGFLVSKVPGGMVVVDRAELREFMRYIPKVDVDAMEEKTICITVGSVMQREGQV